MDGSKGRLSDKVMEWLSEYDTEFVPALHELPGITRDAAYLGVAPEIICFASPARVVVTYDLYLYHHWQMTVTSYRGEKHYSAWRHADTPEDAIASVKELLKEGLEATGYIYHGEFEVFCVLKRGHRRYREYRMEEE